MLGALGARLLRTGSASQSRALAVGRRDSWTGSALIQPPFGASMGQKSRVTTCGFLLTQISPLFLGLEETHWGSRFSLWATHYLLFIYSQPLNNPLNCTGPLICRYFSKVSTTVLHDPRLVESTGAEQWIQNRGYRGTTNTES